MMKARELQTKYLDYFENKNFDLAQIKNYLNEKFPQYSKTSKEAVRKLENSPKNNHNWSASVHYNFALSSNSAYSEKLEKHKNLVKELEAAKIATETITIVASVAAAGFWAAAPWTFGATVSWAIGATIVGTIFGLISVSLSVAISTYHVDLPECLEIAERDVDSAEFVKSVYELGKSIKDILQYPLTVQEATAAANSWAVPAMLTVIPVLGVILTTVIYLCY